MIDNTEKIDGVENSEIPELEEIKKWNTKLVTPVIVLFATSVIAIYAFVKHYPVGDWFVIVFSSVIIFLIIGFIIERMITGFVDTNYEKAIAEAEEARRLEEEARAAMEAEGGDESGIIQDDSTPQL
jgi:p-aminobenzoyl-glutamate transporter AbgT